MRYATMMEAVVKALNETLDKPVTSAVSGRMGAAIELWAAMYEGKPPWLSAKRGIMSAGIPGAISAELARLAMVEFSSAADNPEIDKIYQRMLGGLRVPVEMGCALGGMLFKPYLTDDGIAIQHIRADRFFPLGFDTSGKISECALVEQVYQGKSVFTRLEFYSLPENMILNLAYKTNAQQVNAGLGVRVALDSVPQWVRMAEHVTLQTDRLPFGYFKIPLANTIDADSPLGVSVFARATELIEEADKKYSNICWEYEAKQAAIHISQTLLKRNEETGDLEYPGGRERLYRVLEYNTGAVDKPLIDVFSPDIRANDFYTGYQMQLKMIEFASGLAYGTISDPRETNRTATEVRTSKQRLYVTVTDIQRALEVALRDTVAAIAYWGGQAETGVAFSWGDSVMTDSETLARQALLEVQAGIIDNVEYYKRVYGMSDEGAKELAKEIAERSPQEVELL